MTDNSLSKISRRGVLVGASALAAMSPRPARAVLNIDINQGNVRPMPIALPDFLTGGPAEGDTSRNVTAVISNNLQRSGLFAPINPAAFIEKITSSDNVPKFPDWRAINAEALGTGRITRQGDGRLKAEFRLWDGAAGQQLDGKQYFTTPATWRRIASGAMRADQNSRGQRRVELMTPSSGTSIITRTTAVRLSRPCPQTISAAISARRST